MAVYDAIRISLLVIISVLTSEYGHCVVDSNDFYEITTAGNTYWATVKKYKYSERQTACQKDMVPAVIQDEPEYQDVIKAIRATGRNKIRLWLETNQAKAGVISWAKENIDPSHFADPAETQNLNEVVQCSESCVAVIKVADNNAIQLHSTCCKNEFRHLCADENECEKGTHTCDISKERCVNELGTGYECVKVPSTPEASLKIVPKGGNLIGANLTCSYKGKGTVEKFKWYQNGNFLLDTVGLTFNFDNVLATTEGKYQCSVVVSGLESALSNDVQLTLSVLPGQPKLSVSRDLPVPPRQNVTLTCTPPTHDNNNLAFSWKKNSGQIIEHKESNLHVASFLPSDDASYTCQVQNTASGLFSPDSNDIYLHFVISTPKLSIYALPRVAGDTPRETLQVAKGGGVEFTCKSNDPVDKFFWQTPHSTTARFPSTENFELLNFTPDDHAGNYSCFSEIGDVRSKQSNNVTLQEKDLATPSLSADVTMVMWGSSVTLTCKTSDVGVSNYFLSHGSAIRTMQTSTFQLDNVNSADMGAYKCQTKVNKASSPFSNVVTLSLADSTPRILTNKTAPFPGENVELFCSSPIPTSANFTWKLNGGPVANALVDTLSVSHFGDGDEGNYTCDLKLFDGTTLTSSPLEVSINTSIPKLISSLTNVPEGTLVKLSCQSHNPMHLRFRWQKDDVTFGEGAASTFKILNFENEDQGVYRCLAGDINHNWTPSTAKNLTVIPHNSLCKCKCIANSTSVELSLEEVQEVTSDIQRNLSVDHSHLSSTVRKVMSAPDERTSSMSTGAGAIVMLSLVFCAIIIPDLVTAIYFIKTLVQTYKQ
ncbi:sialoadhesin [Aplysia californica]|uniref:Sialoadhesin n=1 Tax=Aplysia californica TaxID=6500 RepID=A0ABM1A1I2_APLCA|nr:sialoadhesin [Aplysia californica]